MNNLDYNLRIVSKLNELLAADEEFLTNIINARFKVNKNYENSSFIYSVNNAGDSDAGFLGILNGLIMDNEKYRIISHTTDVGEIVKFTLAQFKDGKLVDV